MIFEARIVLSLNCLDISFVDSVIGNDSDLI